MKKLKQILANSCFFGHKWGKWKQYNQEIFINDKPSFDLRQKRFCEKCNKMEDINIRQ